MKAELRPIDKTNRDECVQLHVSREQEPYICSNEQSLKDSADYIGIARPFAVYCDDKMVGFTMFSFDEDYEDINDRYWLWRLMIDEKLQGKGYGKLALESIINYFKMNGANNIRLSTKESNTKAISLYEMFGFRKNGEMNDDETVFELTLRSVGSF